MNRTKAIARPPVKPQKKVEAGETIKEETLKEGPRKTGGGGTELLPGQRAVTDMFGPTVASIGGGRYGMLFKDEVSGFRLGAVLNQKGALKDPMKKMVIELRARSGNDLQTLKCDCEGSYISADFKTVLGEMLIHPLKSGPNDHQQNGLAENEVRVVRKD